MQTGRNGTPCYTNWAIEILPYIEQDALYKGYDQTVLNEHPNNLFVTQSRVKAYECPSDPLKGMLEEPASGPRAGTPTARGNARWMHGSYRGVSGKIQNAINWGCYDTFEPQYWPGGVFDKLYRGVLHGTGVTYNGVPAPTGTASNGQSVTTMGGPERFATITDGTSNTLMVGECTFVDVTRRATFWAYTYASYNQSSIGPQSLHLNHYYGNNTTGSGCWTPTTQYGDQMCKRAFGSLHSNGVNFAMADGSVRYINYSVDIDVLGGMATISRGEVAQIN
jgi:prepilin-type processing-associated H-X9-DG protein